MTGGAWTKQQMGDALQKGESYLSSWVWALQQWLIGWVDSAWQWAFTSDSTLAGPVQVAKRMGRPTEQNYGY